MTITLDKISVAYGKKRGVENVSTQFEAGEFYALIGPNGSGKSTLLKTLSGLLPPQKGHIKHSFKNKYPAQNIAYMPQDRTAHPLMTVQDIVAIGREPYRKPFRSLTATDQTFIDSAIKRADISDIKEVAYGTLSGGQKARVHLARTLAVNAPLLLMDEPAAALDPFYQLSILTALKNEAACGRIVIAALHDLSLVKKFASRVCVMQKGKLVAAGTPADTLTPSILEDVFRVQIVDGEMTLAQA